MKIIWSPQASQALTDIALRIALDKKEAGLKWAKKIEKKVARLRDFPKSGRKVPEIGREEIREIIIDSYRVIYKLTHVISIITVFHGSKAFKQI